MKWIHSFELFLFDFDGLLVNTEHIHYQAYIDALEKFGVKLDWPFSRFCELAHLDGKALRQGICAECPELNDKWQELYEEKKRIYLSLIGAGKVELMKGVEPLLKALYEANIRRCVVTNSFYEQTSLIRSRLGILETIEKWVTREDYEKAKPAPDGYLRAIELYGKKGDRIVGFEDSIRGIKSLSQTPALPVLICPVHHPLLEIAKDQAYYFPSFSDIPQDFHSNN